ncbi:MAG: hypothetical protein H0U70_10880 [Tatlockia sp.]|nr:hypothetical protein [Tatlockia sp.]
MKNDNQNEAVGIIAIFIIIILAAVGLYYFFSHRPPTALNVEGSNPNVPVEAPHPHNFKQGQLDFKLIKTG